MRRDLPAGTVTFLFTDVEGSTKLLHELGAAAYAKELADHRRIVREACTARGGVEVDTQGDAFFIAFPAAPNALEAAREIAEELASGRITLRIGLHTGAPLVTDEGYIGDDVHFAARVAASAHGGQVVLSQATRSLLDERYPLLDLGEHRLKDIPAPVPIFQLGSKSFPPLKTISNTNLPRPTSSFVGRERELRDVLDRLEAGGRLVTLTGPGGSGKTRLALEAAAALVPEYKAGVFWVGLASLRDPTLVSETIAQTLGARDGLAEHIGGREMLLLLDNLEQVIEAASELSSLLQSCPNLTLLVTSRELLRVQGEAEYPVPPLAEAEAVSLFCERTQTQPTEEISELCRRLDSLPLAVELAAARTKALSPAQILGRLSQRLDLLKGGRDADPRQQTLRATIEWSYDLLSADERELFCRLAVFAGGCRLEAAEQVAGADIDTLQSLVEKSLVRHSDERYWMLETVREYAEEQLHLSGEAPDARRRHVTYFLALAESADKGLKGAAQNSSLELLASEHANLRAALESLARADDATTELRLTAALWHFWSLKSLFTEGLQWLGHALARDRRPSAVRARALVGAAVLARGQGDDASGEALAEESLAIARACDDQWAVARALSSLGSVRAVKGDLDAARELLAESVAVSTAIGDQWGLAVSTMNLGYIELLGEHWPAAESLFTRSHAAFAELRDAKGTSMSLLNLGIVAFKDGRLADARTRFEDSVALARRIEDRATLAYGLDSLGAVLAAEGDLDGAAGVLGYAAAVTEAVGTSLPPAEERVHEQTLAMLRERLGEAALDAAWEYGRQAAAEQAVERVLPPRRG